MSERFLHFFEADLLRERLIDFLPPIFEADLLRERLLDFLPPFLEADLLRDRLLDFLSHFLDADLLRERLLDFLPRFFETDLLRDRLLDFFPPGLFERDLDGQRLLKETRSLAISRVLLLKNMCKISKMMKNVDSKLSQIRKNSQLVSKT